MNSKFRERSCLKESSEEEVCPGFHFPGEYWFPAFLNVLGSTDGNNMFQEMAVQNSCLVWHQNIWIFLTSHPGSFYIQNINANININHSRVVSSVRIVSFPMPMLCGLMLSIFHLFILLTRLFRSIAKIITVNNIQKLFVPCFCLYIVRIFAA